MAPTSDFYTRMTFDLLYGDKNITSFEFVDYRGGAITDPDNQRHVQELFGILSKAMQ